MRPKCSRVTMDVGRSQTRLLRFLDWSPQLFPDEQRVVKSASVAPIQLIYRGRTTNPALARTALVTIPLLHVRCPPSGAPSIKLVGAFATGATITRDHDGGAEMFFK